MHIPLGTFFVHGALNGLKLVEVITHYAYWLFRLFSPHISRTQSFQQNRHINFLALVALKLFVSLISRLVACSARIVADELCSESIKVALSVYVCMSIYLKKAIGRIILLFIIPFFGARCSNPRLCPTKLTPRAAFADSGLLPFGPPTPHLYTHRQTHRTTTVTLAAHARRELIIQPLIMTLLRTMS